ncbi:MAG: type I DNA topoisomerase [Chloroflexi bacterium]|nr:type I DNA topoisomerase [Chloroflexota bacterium]
MRERRGGVARQDGSVRLVIVESPAKARTIEKYLGAGYVVRASMGHVRDLPKRDLGVDVAHGFIPTYEVPADKAATVRDLRARAKTAEAVYLATDPDREGEAIAWHLVQTLGLHERSTHRVEFHSITRAAVSDAMQRPRRLNQHLVDSQQARRVLDRLVGYRISPLLWRAVRRGLSAGRVQSVAVRLIVDREREIAAFEPREYWTISGRFERTDGPARARRPFEARLHRFQDALADLPNEAAAQQALAALQDATYTVSAAETKPQERRPAPPFTTSTLQQEAARKLNMPAKMAMSVAQQLYEGVDLGGATEGLITYMRTDSLTVAPEAQAAARTLIVERWGDRAAPQRPPVYRARTKGAQEAHEAVRPTNPRRDPDSVRGRLSPAQHRLYRLIWQRFIASQMSPALLDVTTVDIAGRTPAALPPPAAPIAEFRATGSVIVYPGFLQVYREGIDDGDDGLDEAVLPPLTAGDAVRSLGLTPAQHFTKPPPRFTEASLVKRLEEAGVGRPSTYAAIIATILDREYVERRDKQMVPTDLGTAVTDLLVQHFPDILDPGFTATIEERLDDVAAGTTAWTPVLAAFNEPFAAAVDRAATTMERVRLPAAETGEACPSCSQPLVQRTGRYGPFIACSAYPACTYTRPVLSSSGVVCPACSAGELVQRTAKATKKAFWGCNRYPACTHVEWYRPLPERCPRCNGHLSEVGRGRKRCITCQGQPPPTRRVRPAAAPGRTVDASKTTGATATTPRPRRAGVRAKAAPPSPPVGRRRRSLHDGSGTTA